MALDIKKDNLVVGERAFPPVESLRFVRPIKNLLELVPAPAIFWSLQRHFCIPNRKAHQWVHSAKNDFREYASSWTRRIHRLDRPRFLSVWELLQSQEAVQCDYRFSPDGLEQHLWLREVSACYRNWRGEAEGLISVYTDISDLKAESLTEVPELKDQPENPALQALGHDVANCIHSISMELELLGWKSQGPVELLDMLNRLQWLMRQLLDSCVAQSPEPAAANFRPVLEDMVRRFRRNLSFHGVEVEFCSDDVLPEVQIGSEALCQILEQLVGFYSAQLRGSDKLKMEFRVVASERGEQLEVKLGGAAHDHRDGDSEQPVLQFDDRRVGVSRAVAQEILRHYPEKISFANSSSWHRVLTLRFDAKPPAR